MSSDSAVDVSGINLPHKYPSEKSRAFSRISPGHSTVYSLEFNFSREPKFRFSIMADIRQIESVEEYCAIAIDKDVYLNGPVLLCFTFVNPQEQKLLAWIFFIRNLAPSAEPLAGLCKQNR